MTQENHSKSGRICVIGAGPSGLAALKALKQAGFSPDCFEMGTEVGGLWAINNENGRGGAYESLHINTSTKAMQFSDFPMPTDIGDFPAHPHIARYFAEYADHFDLPKHIHFRKEVVKCRPQVGGYSVHIRDRISGAEETTSYGALVVCNGHHWSPAYPEASLWKDYRGHVSHAHEYVNPRCPHDFSQERVLVVGMGNSAMDIACELSREGGASSVTVSARRGAWVLPKYIRGQPLDQGRVVPMWLPSKLRRKIVTSLFKMMHGEMTSYGLPEPDHLIGEAHPTVSSEFPERVKSGHIRMKPAFNSSENKRVTFADGSVEEFDAIVFCTGYNVEFPFFDREHVSAPDNRLPLYFRAFHLEHRRLFFVGLAQTVGAIMPVAESQAKAIAAHLAGKYSLPEIEVMRATVEREEAEMRRRFVASRRHSMQVIPELFQPKLKRDRKLGKRRAETGKGLAFPGFIDQAKTA